MFGKWIPQQAIDLNCLLTEPTKNFVFTVVGMFQSRSASPLDQRGQLKSALNLNRECASTHRAKRLDRQWDRKESYHPLPQEQLIDQTKSSTFFYQSAP